MAHLDALAGRPRPTGSEATASALDYCATHLVSLGFTVTRRPFEFSALPGRLGPAMIGGTSGSLTLLTCALGASASRMTLYVAVLAVLVTIGLGRRLGGADATRAAGPMRESGVNLEAARGSNPKVWLVAHIDSKSQTISTAARTIAVLLLTVGLIAAAICAGLRLVVGVPVAIWIIVGAIAGLGGGTLLRCRVGAMSAGAADNASGVAAVLEAAGLVANDKSLGVLITDAEELALAGARAWVVGREPAIAINCDTIDDAGTPTLFHYGSGALLASAVRALDATADVVPPGSGVMKRGGPVRTMAAPPGVLTDSVAFEAAGWTTVTLARGNARTLGRIHTARDDLHGLRGSAVPAVARALARLVEELA